MANQLKNMLIGLFLIIASFLVIGIVLFIKPSVGDGRQILNVRFNNINGISNGTPVTYAGRTIGEVEEIAQIVQAREQAVNEFGQVYPYLLTLKIDSNYTIFTTDEITVQTQGLLGEKYVAIIPKPLKPGQLSHVVSSKDIIYADANDLLESAMNEISVLSQKIEGALDKVIAWIQTYGDTLGSAVHSFDLTMTETSKAIKTFNDLGIMYNIKDAARNFAASFQRIDESLCLLQQEEFFQNTSALMAHAEEIASKIRDGKGTLGKLLEEEGLYLQVSALMSKANTLLNDINQYGLLFQYNHEWQRNRVKLMSKANAVKDAKAFQAFMDSQIDQINTTLERMAMLTDRFTTKELSENPRFRKKFKELMDQLNTIQTNIQLYNQELFEMGQKTDHE